MTSDPVVGVLLFLALGGAGLIAGSFLSVVIYRVPRDLSVAGSACPGCGTAIAARDRIPVLSWLILRGRCRTCDQPISARYPMVELLTGVLWIALGWWSWQPAGTPALLPWLLVLGSAGVALFVIDVDHHRLPDAIVLPLYPLGAVGLAVAGLVTGEWALTSVLVGVGAWLVPIGGIWLLTGGRAMGFGDVKLAPVLAATLAWVGVSSAVVGLLAAFVSGGLAGLVLMLSGRARRGSHLAFGPFLLLGSLVGLLWGEAIGAAYLDRLGL